MKERQVHFFLLMNSGFIIDPKGFNLDSSLLCLFLFTAVCGKFGADIKCAPLQADDPT
jgi:hypothetical protein